MEVKRVLQVQIQCFLALLQMAAAVAAVSIPDKVVMAGLVVVLMVAALGEQETHHPQALHKVITVAVVVHYQAVGVEVHLL